MKIQWLLKNDTTKNTLHLLEIYEMINDNEYNIQHKHSTSHFQDIYQFQKYK